MAYLGEYYRIKALRAPPAGALGEEGRDKRPRLRPPRLQQNTGLVFSRTPVSGSGSGLTKTHRGVLAIVMKIDALDGLGHALGARIYHEAHGAVGLMDAYALASAR